MRYSQQQNFYEKFSKRRQPRVCYSELKHRISNELGSLLGYTFMQTQLFEGPILQIIFKECCRVDSLQTNKNSVRSGYIDPTFVGIMFIITCISVSVSVSRCRWHKNLISFTYKVHLKLQSKMVEEICLSISLQLFLSRRINKLDDFVRKIISQNQKNQRNCESKTMQKKGGTHSQSTTMWFKF